MRRFPIVSILLPHILPGTVSNTTVASAGVKRQVWFLTTVLIIESRHSIAVMLMETFDRLTIKDKFVWDVSGVCRECHGSTVYSSVIYANIDLWTRELGFYALTSYPDRHLPVWRFAHDTPCRSQFFFNRGTRSLESSREDGNGLPVYLCWGFHW